MNRGIEARNDQVLELTKQLIRIPSTKEDPNAIHLALELASQELRDIPHQRFETTDTNKIIIPSLVYYNTPTLPERFHLLLHAHLDVVPAQLNDQFIPTERNDRLYGRGAMDMKSGAAALITAFGDLASGLQYPIGLSITTDEETGGFHGAGHQVEQGILADYVLTGEATGLKIGNECKGVMILGLSTNTEGGHTAYEGDEYNSLQKMVRFLHEANQLYPGPTEEWCTTSSLTQLSTTNHAHNVVPSDATAELTFRYIAEDDPEQILETIGEIDRDIHITKGPFAVACYSPEDHPITVTLKNSIQEVSGEFKGFDRKSGASDVRHWVEAGASGIEFGPIGSGLSGPNEYLDISSLGTYYEIIRHFLKSLDK